MNNLTIFTISISLVLRMKNPVPIATDIPAATVPTIETRCEGVIVNVQSPGDFHVQLMHSQYQLHRLDAALLPWCSVTMVIVYCCYRHSNVIIQGCVKMIKFGLF